MEYQINARGGSRPGSKPFALALAGLAVVATLGLASGAQAQVVNEDEYGAAYVRVPLGDLNLDSRPGAEAALDRIRDAARLVCGRDTDIRVLERRDLYRRCLVQATARGVAQLPAPTVAAAGPADDHRSRLADNR